MKNTLNITVQNQTINFVILRPAGNDTALVLNPIEDEQLRQQINNRILSKYPSVEQVGFVNLSSKSSKLIMAGGEFCGNAARCTAWIAQKGKPGEIALSVSGVDQVLRAGVTSDFSAWSQMPVDGMINQIVTPICTQSTKVTFEGITHVVIYDSKVSGLSEADLKQKAFNILEKQRLTKSVIAAGVMFVTQTSPKVVLKPVVWVRDIQTLYYETACGSGTCAVGLDFARKQNKSISLSVIQPSLGCINTKVVLNKEVVTYAEISGEIQECLTFNSLRNTL